MCYGHIIHLCHLFQIWPNENFHPMPYYFCKFHFKPIFSCCDDIIMSSFPAKPANTVILNGIEPTSSSGIFEPQLICIWESSWRGIWRNHVRRSLYQKMQNRKNILVTAISFNHLYPILPRENQMDNLMCIYSDSNGCLRCQSQIFIYKQLCCQQIVVKASYFILEEKNKRFLLKFRSKVHCNDIGFFSF